MTGMTDGRISFSTFHWIKPIILLCLILAAFPFCGNSVFAEEENKNESEALLDALLTKQNATAKEYVSLAATVFYEYRDTSTVAKAYDRALELEPTNLDALRGRAILHAYGRDWDMALSLLDRAIAAHEDYLDGYWERAYVLCRKGDTENAGKAIADARENKASVCLTASVAGQLAFIKGDYALAAEEWNTAIQRKDTKPDTSLIGWEVGTVMNEAYIGRGYALLAIDEYEQAAAHFRFLQERYKQFLAKESLTGMYLCIMAAEDSGAARKAVKDLMEGKQDPGGSASSMAFLQILAIEKDDDKIAGFLREQIETHASWGGGDAYLAAKWAQRTKRENLADAFFTIAARQKQGYFYPALLAERELAAKNDAKAQPVEQGESRNEVDSKNENAGP